MTENQLQVLNYEQIIQSKEDSRKLIDMALKVADEIIKENEKLQAQKHKKKSLASDVKI